MKTIYHLTDIAAPRAAVLDALTSIERLTSWWTTEASGDGRAGGEVTFTFGGTFNPVMHVIGADPDGVTWRCTDGVEQWADNTFRFDLASQGEGTRLRFRQEYAVELSDDDYAIYNYNWGYYLESLRLLCVYGTGQPYHPGAGAPVPEVARGAARKLAADVFGRGDLGVYDELFADDYINHNIPVPGIPGTKDGFRELVIATRAAFPDLAVEVQDIVVEGDLVVFHDHVTATSTGAFFGVPPSGTVIDWTEIHFLRVRDGQITEHWTNFDQLGILRQLGALPT